MDIGALRMVLSMATAEFTGPAKEAGETFKSSGGLIEAAGSSIKGAIAEALSGTPLSEFATLWQEVSEKVGEAAGEVEGAVEKAGEAAKTAFEGDGGSNPLTTSMQESSVAADKFAETLTAALAQVKEALNLGGGGSGLDALDTELATTGDDAEATAAKVAAAMETIESSIQAVSASGGLTALDTELATTGAAADAAGSSSVASGAAMGGAFALAPQIALITGLTMALSKVPEAIDAVTEAGKDYDESVQTMAQTTGLSVTAASTLLDTFQHFGTPIEQANKDIDQMSKNAITASEGTNKQSQAFADLGVSLTNTDGTMKSANEIFMETGSALAAMADGVNKNNDEMLIFGRSGTDLNEMFHSGSLDAQDWADGIATIQQQALATGHYLSGEGYDAFEKYQTASRNSSDSLATLKETLGNDLIPVMTDFDNDLAKTASWLDEKVVPAVGHGIDAFKQIWSEIGPVRSILGDLSSFAGGEFSEAFTQLGELLDGPFGSVIKLLAAVVLVGFITALVAVVAPVVAIATALDLTIGALNEFGDVLNKATQWGKELYDSMKQAGVDFIQGLEDGIDSKVDDLMSDVKSIPTNILSTFETELGISSPSTKGIGIGANFAGAVGLGITQNASMVNAAVSALGQGMTTTGTSMAVASGTHMVSPMMGSGGSQQAAQPVVIHNYMGNKPIETVVGTAMNGVFRQQSRRQN